MRNEQIFLVKSISGMIADADYVFFINYAGIKVKDFSDFRNQLAELGGSCHVLKNTLILKAAEALNISDIDKANLTGDTAMVYGKGDCGAVAKLITEFGKKCDKLKAKSAFIEGAVLDAGAVSEIADLPSKDVLRAMLLGVLQAPARNLVSVLNAKAASILNVLNAYKEKLEQN